MAVYSILSKEELQDIANQYGFKIVNCAPIEGGHSNSNYRIETAKERFIFTVFAQKSKLEVRQLVALQDWLLRRRFPIDEVIPALSGKKVLEIDNKPLIVKKWIDGKVIETLDTFLLRQAGRSLAQLHQIPPPNFLSKQHSFGISIFPNALETGIDLKYESWLKKQIKYLKKHISYHLPSGLIHGDLFSDNILFENRKLKAVIDFEYACEYPFVFDLGMTVAANCAVNEQIDDAKLKALIGGYEEIRLLEKPEREFLPLFVEYAATASSVWRFMKFHILDPTPNKADRHWKMVRLAKNIRMKNH